MLLLLLKNARVLEAFMTYCSFLTFVAAVNRHVTYRYLSCFFHVLPLFSSLFLSFLAVCFRGPRANTLWLGDRLLTGQQRQSSGAYDSQLPCDESWKLITKLRQDVTPEKLRMIVNRCGLPTGGKKSSDLEIDCFDLKSQATRSARKTGWMTMADIKVQAVKEICYLVALNGFNMTHSEIEAMCLLRLQDMCQQYGKRDPNPSETWKSVARDVMDTIGICGDGKSDKSFIYGSNKAVIVDDATLYDFERREVVKDVVKELVDRVVGDDSTVESQAENQPADEVRLLKDSMSTLIEMLEGVKQDNECKQEEMQLMKRKMEEMEKAFSGNAQYGKSLLMEEFVKDVASNMTRGDAPAKKANTNTVSSDTSDSGKPASSKSDAYKSPRFIQSDDFSKPSPGVVVPDHIKTKDEQIAWLMENDVAFRRGRLRWEAQQKRHQANLRSQEINKERRRQLRDVQKQSKPDQNFPAPRFAFKGNGQCQKLEKKRQPTRKYFEGPRRKTLSCLEANSKDKTQHRKNFETRFKDEVTVQENANDSSPTNVNKDQVANDQVNSDANEGMKTQPGPQQGLLTRAGPSNSVPRGRNYYFQQRRKTWGAFQDPYVNKSPSQPSVELNFPHKLHRSDAHSRNIGTYTNWSQPVYHPSWIPDPSYGYRFGNPANYYQFPVSHYRAVPESTAFPPLASYEIASTYNNNQSLENIQQALPPYGFYEPLQAANVQNRGPERVQFFIGENPRHSSSSSAMYDPLPPQIYHNPLDGPSSKPDVVRSNESPPYMSTATDDLGSLSVEPLKLTDSLDAAADGKVTGDCRKRMPCQGIYQPPFRRQTFRNGDVSWTSVVWTWGKQRVILSLTQHCVTRCLGRSMFFALVLFVFSNHDRNCPFKIASCLPKISCVILLLCYAPAKV